MGPPASHGPSCSDFGTPKHWQPEIVLLPAQVSEPHLQVGFSTFLLLPSLSSPSGYDVQALCLDIHKISDLSWVTQVINSD